MIDKRRLARFVVPCLERLANADPGVADQRIGHVVVQKILRSALNHRVADDLRRRAAVLLIRVPSYEAIPHLVRAAPMMGNPTSVSVLDWAAKTLAKKSLILPPAKTLHLLKRMEAAVREVERRSAALSPAALACLAKVKSQVEARLKKANQAAGARTKKQKTPALTGLKPAGGFTIPELAPPAEVPAQ